MRQQLGREQLVASVHAHMGTHGQYFFHRAFAYQLMVVLTLGYNHRHPSTLEVERNFIHFAVVGRRVQRTVDFRMFQHGYIQQILQPCLVVAVEVGHLQHIVRVFSLNIHMASQKNLVLRERAGFVRAKNIHGAKVLDGIQPLHNHLLPRQLHGAFGQCGRHDHGQHFRREANGNGHGKQESFCPAVLGQAVDEKHQRNHHEHEANQQPGDFVHALLELGGCAVGCGNALRQRAEIGLAAGMYHNGRGRAGHHIGAHEHQIFQIQRRCGISLFVNRKFLDGQRLPRHGRLADKQVFGCQQPAIGRHHIASSQGDNISGHQLLDGYFHFSGSRITTAP